MEYPSDTRAHDSGYFTPSPDKENKLTSTILNYPQLENLNNCILNNPNIRNVQNSKVIEINNQKLVTNIGNNHDMDRPPHSYIALISMAILSKPEKKILLNEIYDWVIHNFAYYQHRTDKSWRNSIRHNLSLNECFIKVGKAGNGRGYYWSIHPANLVDFKKGDFRRRQARLRAKHDKGGVTSSSTTSSTNSQNSTRITNRNTTTNNNMNNTMANDNCNNDNNNNSNNNNSSLNDSNSMHHNHNHHHHHNSNINLSNHHYTDASSAPVHHQTNQLNTINTTPTGAISASSMINSNLCSPPQPHHHHHHQLINNDINNTSYHHANMNLNCTLGSPGTLGVPVSHNMQPMPPSIYHHHSTPNQQNHHHQYNYVAATFPWLTAAAAQQIQSSTNNFLETFTSSALACGAYNSIIPHSYSAPNEISNDNSLYYHNFHNK